VYYITTCLAKARSTLSTMSTTPSPPATASITNLPMELALRYMSYLSSPDLLSLAQTTKALYPISLEAAYTWVKISACEGPDIKYNRSHRRVIALTMALLQDPSLARRVTSLDLDLMPHNYEGVFERVMPGRSQDRTVEEERLYDSVVETVEGYTDYRDWIWQGNIVGWTYLLFILTPNLETLHLGNGYGVFVENWRTWMYDYRDTDKMKRQRRWEVQLGMRERQIWDGVRGVYNPFTTTLERDRSEPGGCHQRNHMLAVLPGLRSVRHVHLGDDLQPSWEWMTLPSLRSYSHVNIQKKHDRWLRDGKQTSRMQVLRTNMPTSTTEDVLDQALSDPPFCNFPSLRAVYISLVTKSNFPSTQGCLNLSVDRSRQLTRPFKRLLPLAPTLEILEMRILEGTDAEGSMIDESPITQLQQFTALKHLGLPAYILTSQWSVTALEDLGLQEYLLTKLWFASDLPLDPCREYLLPIEMLPPNLEVLSVFANGDNPRLSPESRNIPYADALGKIARNVLDGREHVRELRCIRIDHARLGAGESALLPLEELQEAGIRIEAIEAVQAL
jgi:hypothetical protein